MRASQGALAIGLLVTATAASAADDGAAMPPSGSDWAQWQGRVGLVSPMRGAASLGSLSSRTSTPSASVLGDFYFGRTLVPSGQLGGLRATSGLMVGPRPTLMLGQTARANGSSFSIARGTSMVAAPLPGESDTSATMPYLGLGYTGLSVRGGWSYSADLGMAGNALRLGRSAGSGANLDDAVRDLRMSPLVQVGVSYSF